MLTGYNTDFKFQGQIYHCQTEDGGINSPFITSLMYHQGAILARRKTSYEDIIKADCLEDVVRELMMEQHKQMIRDLMQGKLEVNANAASASLAPAPAAPPKAAAPAAPAPPAAPKPQAPAPAAPAAPAKASPPPPKPASKDEDVKEKSLDDVILEFLEQENKSSKKK
ncbi:MAG: hypothetical protein M0042_11355 [Nitrospiraceae bacterium]|nr:hypothetical protein [Nitrospiraceae bacterium]